MEKPKISVILTSFNHEKYLREAIESVLAQTYSGYELFIIDDASSDNSFEIIQSYADKRIIPIQNEKQKRGIWGYNKIISEMAQGDYIAIHHSDDVWEPTKLEKQIAFLENHTDVGAVFTNAMAIDENGQPFEDKNHFYYSIFDQPNRTRHEWLNFFFYQGNALCHPSVLIRKECYDVCGLYRYGLAQLGDYDMWIRLCLKYEIHVLPKKLMRFRILNNEANSSGNTPEKRVRSVNEHFFILQNFRLLTVWDDLVRVFPEAQKFYNAKGFVSEFILAMMALEHNAWRDTQLLGLMLLYELVNDKEKAIKVKELYGFDYLKLIALSPKYDSFNIEQFFQTNYIQLFFDLGNGFNEENSIKLPVQQTADWQEFIFDVSNTSSFQGLRLDPLNECCVIELKSLHVKKENEMIDLMPYVQNKANANHDKIYFFTTDDSFLHFSGFGEDIFQKALAILMTVRYVHRGKDALHVKLAEQEKELNALKEKSCFKILKKVGLL